MRAYLIENDRAKLMALVKEGKSVEEIKAAMPNVQPKAVDAWIAGTPEIAAKLGKKAEKADAKK